MLLVLEVGANPRWWILKSSKPTQAVA
jgi:hypothetical protein